MKNVVRLFAVLASLCAAGAAFAADKAAPSAADKADTFAIDHVMGKADAPITIIEYASTTCGHCANLHIETLPKIKAEWVDTGKAKLIYRDFPTAPAHMSIGASMIAHCAGPERYYGVLALIMEQQHKWMESSNPLDSLKKLVRIAGMTGQDVDACLGRQDLANAIQDRARAGNTTFGIEATPTMIINGTIVEGHDPEKIFQVLKDAAK